MIARRRLNQSLVIIDRCARPRLIRQRNNRWMAVDLFRLWHGDDVQLNFRYMPVHSFAFSSLFLSEFSFSPVRMTVEQSWERSQKYVDRWVLRFRFISLSSSCFSWHWFSLIPWFPKFNFFCTIFIGEWVISSLLSALCCEWVSLSYLRCLC